MTWDFMTHEKATYKHVVAEKGKVIGFQLGGMTYDGDGNCQWDEGTTMDIYFKNRNELFKLMEALNKYLKEEKE